MIAYCLDLLTEFAQTYDELVSFREIFSVTFKFLALLPSDNYPEEIRVRNRLWLSWPIFNRKVIFIRKIKKKIANLRELIDEKSSKSREYLQCLSKKPVANKLFEPRVEAK